MEVGGTPPDAMQVTVQVMASIPAVVAIIPILSFTVSASHLCSSLRLNYAKEAQARTLRSSISWSSKCV
jgi:hypothetical protein